MVKSGEYLKVSGILIVGILIGLVVHNFGFLDRGTKEVKYQYTNNLLDCGDISNIEVGKVESVKKNIEGYISYETSIGTIDDAAVYFRDLRNGPWFGIDEDKYYYPASLLKAPLALAAYKQEEVKPGFLDRKVVYDHKILDTTYIFPPQEKIEVGKSYSLRELLERSLKYSDNEAAALLGESVTFDKLSKVFRDFGIEMPKPGEDYKIRVQTYASFFRVLFNASYLTRDHSEELLKTFTETTFADGLVAGVPKDVDVAHKYGEREGGPVGSGIQVHDCGIVFSTSRPYLLCVMVQAKKAENATRIIREISAKVYGSVTGTH